MISRAEQVVCEVDLRQYQMQAAQAAAQQQQPTTDDHIRATVS